MKEHHFQIGDVVEFTNDFGVKFGPRTVTGFRTDDPDFNPGLLPERTIYIDDDSPWFPVRPESLKKVTEKAQP